MASPTSIANIALIVRDYDEAIEFYTKKLGFSVVEDVDGSPHRWVLIAPSGRSNTSGCSLVVSKATNDDEMAAIGNQTGGRVGFFLFTDNFERDHKSMKDNGVEFLEDPRHEVYGTVAVFRDLYGNKWDLLEQRQPNESVTEALTIRVDTYDVFASQQFQGNQLAVFTGFQTGDLSDAQMQTLAMEMNYAETVFVTRSEKPGRFKYRIFTCHQELDFAGHPTLGTAYHAFHQMITDADRDFLGGQDKLELECKAGVIPVSREVVGDSTEYVYWMRQNPPSFKPLKQVSLDDLAAVLGCATDCLGHNPQIVSTGTPFIIVPIRDYVALKSIKHMGASFQEFCREYGIVGAYCVAFEGRDSSHSISARCMVDEDAVPEDPATGSACGCFAGWLAHNRMTNFAGAANGRESTNFIVGQGHEMGRPSLLHVRISRDVVADGPEVKNIEIEVGGTVKPVIANGSVSVVRT